MILSRQEIQQQYAIVMPNLEANPEDWKLADLVRAMMQRIAFLESCSLSGEIPKDLTELSGDN